MEQIAFPDVLPVFLEALNYPEFARPEFFVKKQRESGWSKGSYLQALSEAYHHFELKLSIHQDKEKAARRRNNQPDEDIDTGIPLEKETAGKQKGLLTREVLKDLLAAVNFAYKLDVPTPVYSAYEVLAFAERMLLFAREQFNTQIEKNGNATFIAARQRKKGHTIYGKPEYVIYHYHIISRAPIFDYHRYRNEVRNLLLNSQNPQALKVMQKPILDLCVNIVNLWNNKLSRIEEPFDENAEFTGKGIFEDRLLRLDDRTLQVWNVNFKSMEDMYREMSTRYTNREFAVFASRVANLIADEVVKLKGKRVQEIPESNEINKLEDLFSKKEAFQLCVDILRKVNPVVINENNQFLLGPRNKGALVAWINAMKSKGLLYPADREKLSILLSEYFTGVNFGKDGKTFSNTNTTSYKKYYKQILNLLP